MLRLELKDHSYPIYVGKDILSHIGEYLLQKLKPSKVLVVSDESIVQLYTPIVTGSLVEQGLDVYSIDIPSGEESKSLEQFSRIQDSLIEKQFDRSSIVIALGGGVVGDLTGFAAAVYMRGIPFVQIPTTLQAQVDASVGGKTAINHQKGKNLIGAFHQPKLVLIDVNTLESLPKPDIRAGLIEVIKMGVIRDEPLFQLVEETLDGIIDLDERVLIEMISQACAGKADIVAKDEKESSLRMVLNYGHTFGHALEAVTEYKKYRHGEAVSIGMNCAARLAANLKIFSESDFQRQNRLLRDAKLPVTFPQEHSHEEIYAAMYHDKKVIDGSLRLILPIEIGNVVIRDDIPETKVKEAIIQCY
ncbi:3-dehydroquinate synthase [Candidatus Poribacteria bacterium]|nr:MAG: 3-dehydroquinate synthase [Candidatus Poribacteria bacterium]